MPQTALALEDLFRRAGLPDGAFSNLFVPSSEIAALIHDPRIAAVTLTGSEPAGMSVAAAAGDALKKTVLELGGSDPFVVLASADLDDAVRTAVTARVQNNGQSCIASKRFIVVDAVADEFESRFIESMDALVVGDPFDPATNIGPDRERGAAGRARRPGGGGACAQGATVHNGAPIPDGDGWWFAPTVLSGVTTDMPIAKVEMFGPVAMVIRVPDVDAAIAAANDTSFGLGSSVWGSDEAEIAQCVEGIEAGAVFVNAMVASMPELPFGGIKRSGYGRELSESASRSSPTPRPSTSLDRHRRLTAPASHDLPRPRRHHAAAARGGSGHGRRCTTASSATRPAATRRPSGPGACSRRPATRWPPSSAATPATSSSPPAAPSRPTWPFWGRPRRPGRTRGEAVLLSSAVEHPAVREAARAAAKAGLDTRELPVDAAGIVDPDALARTLSSRVTSVPIMTANNETGRDPAAGRPHRDDPPPRPQRVRVHRRRAGRALRSTWPRSRPAPTWSRSARTRSAVRSAWARSPSPAASCSSRASTAGDRSASGAAAPRTWRVRWGWPPRCAW